MLKYLANRLLLLIPTLLGVAVITFFMLRVIPGDIVEVKLRGDGGNVSQETIEFERARLGLNKPLIFQFADWMKGLATFDLGTSMWTGRPVKEEIAIRLELSVQVAIMASFFAVCIAIPLGTISALFRGTLIDYAVRIVTIGSTNRARTVTFWRSGRSMSRLTLTLCGGMPIPIWPICMLARTK